MHIIEIKLTMNTARVGSIALLKWYLRTVGRAFAVNLLKRFTDVIERQIIRCWSMDWSAADLLSGASKAKCLTFV